MPIWHPLTEPTATLTPRTSNVPHCTPFTSSAQFRKPYCRPDTLPLDVFMKPEQRVHIVQKTILHSYRTARRRIVSVRVPVDEPHLKTNKTARDYVCATNGEPAEVASRAADEPDVKSCEVRALAVEERKSEAGYITLRRRPLHWIEEREHDWTALVRASGRRRHDGKQQSG